MPIKEMHTVCNNDENRWENKKPGNFQNSLSVPTKQKAMELTRKQSIKEMLERVPHKKNDGKIQNSNSYGNDPYPPKGKTLISATFAGKYPCLRNSISKLSNQSPETSTRQYTCGVPFHAKVPDSGINISSPIEKL